MHQDEEFGILSAMKTTFAMLSVLFVFSALATRTTVDFNEGWEFSRDQVSWQAVEVPHDWAIAGPFDPEGEAGTGQLPWKGIGWYRKTVILDDLPKGRLFLDFDGVMSDATLFLNGHPCARGPYGYLGFTADCTPYLFKGTNTFLVKADTTKLRSRWYPGAGLYRRVRRIDTDNLYLDARDVQVTTPEVSASRATLQVVGHVTSRLLQDANAALSLIVKAPDGTPVATAAATPVTVPACDQVAFALTATIEKPRLWTMEPDAALYTVEISVQAPGCADTLCVRTGFRSFRFDPDKGFFLNGARVQLNGVDLHSDLGILGMAFNRSAMRRQLAAMRDMGANALRTSHNPPAPELLDLCDEMGFFVWDECFDKWNETCGRGDEPLESFVEARLAEFVRRDRNHPSVFAWSIGNEIPIGGGASPGQELWNIPGLVCTTPERCTRFRRVILAHDTTRPVGIGSCFPKAGQLGHYDNLDITGWNYAGMYDKMRAHAPQKPLLYTESASAFSDYGYYAPRLPTNKTDYAVADLAVTSYDFNAAAWSDIPDREFERMERDTYVGGEFVWTGIDYLGEPSPYGDKSVNGRPLAARDRARSAYFGIYDLLVFPKDRAYLYRAHWNKKAFTLHLVPDHWTFPERAGKKMPVFVYTSAPEAELFVNGVSCGRRRKDPAATMATGYYGGLARYRLMWQDIPWQAGEIKVLAYDAAGKKLGEETLRTAGLATRVVLAPESATLPDDPREFVFARVTLADAAGTPVPRDDRTISFSVTGPARIISVGNANPRGHDSFKDVARHPLYNGRAGLVLHRTAPGPVTLTASAPGLIPAHVTFR